MNIYENLKRKLSVLFADDHPGYRRGMIFTIEQLPYVDTIVEANDGIECIREMELQHFDIVLLDINMPKMDGLECLEVIKSRWPDVVVIVLTQYSEHGLSKRTLELGAAGHLVKSTTEQEFISNFETIYFRKETVVAKGVKTHYKNRNSDEAVKFGATELKVLKLLCDEYTSKEISIEIGYSLNTINSHRQRLLEKTNSKNIAGLINWAYRNGVVEQFYQTEL